MSENSAVFKERKVLLTLCYFSFGMIGLLFSMRTNIFQYVQADYLDGYTHIASLVLISGILMQFPLFLTGLFIEKKGFQKALLLGMISFSLPVFLLFFVRSVLFFDVAFTLLMLGYGISVMALNLFTSNLHPERKGNVLLMLHLYFAVGALFGPRLISQLTDSGFSWQFGIVISGLPLLIVIAAIFSINRKVSFSMEYEGHAESSLAGKGSVKNPIVWLFVVIFLCSQTWEFGMATWFVIYANDTSGLDPSSAAWYLSMFYGSYPLVRIIFSRFIHRMNLLVVLFIAFSICACFILLGSLSGNYLYFSLTGLGVALLYPAIIASMQEHFGGRATKTIGFVTMMGGLIQYVAIWSVGIISNQQGIEKGFSSLIWYMLAGALTVLAVFLLEKKQSSSEMVYSGRLDR